MKKFFKIALFTTLFGLLTQNLIAQDESVTPVTKVNETRLIGFINLTYTLGYDAKLGLVKVLVTKSDTVKKGDVISVINTDFTAWISKEYFETLQTGKPYWVHAKWQELKNGEWRDIETPKDPNKVKKNQYCLIFNCGLVQPWPKSGVPTENKKVDPPGKKARRA